MSECYEWVGVKNGKFHQVAEPDYFDRQEAWKPTRMRCGRKVTPSNYFPTRADVLHYCGGREQWLCQQCTLWGQ